MEERLDLDEIKFHGAPLEFIGGLDIRDQVWIDRVFEAVRTGQMAVLKSALERNLYYVYFGLYASELSVEGRIGYVVGFGLRS